MGKVVVVGGGASGLVAAIVASNKHEVILLEANDKCGKKILLTGNGKCNYWNSNIVLDNYNSDNISVLDKIICNQDEVLSFLDSIGIYPKIKNGYYYPYSNQASSVRTILLNEIEKRNVRVVYNFKVVGISRENNGFVVKSDNDEIRCEKVILANGSCSLPKTGSDGSGYDLARMLGHRVNCITPSLVPLIGNDSCFSDWDGVRCDTKLSLYVNDNKVAEETGEIQLTNYGISGICTFNISGLATKNLESGTKVFVRINFLPSIDSFYDWFTERNNNIVGYTIEELLESVIPYKLMFVLLKKAKIDKNSYWDNLNEVDKKKLADTVENFYLEIVGYQSFDRSQVATGGVSLNEVNPSTMESLIVPNLYLVGELLDVDGKCGGFNLAFAFITGYLAGRGI